MHFSLAFPLAYAAFAVALPAASPQDIDFTMVMAVPDPTYSQAIGVTAQAVTFDVSSIIAIATSVVSDVGVETDVSGASSNTERGIAKRSACASAPAGATGAPTVTPDTASAFAANTAIASIASKAAIPTGYSQTFQNLNASNNAYGYLGFATLQTYDAQACATKCDKINGCLAVNIYFERDPSVEPGTGCTNPKSVTMIKCVFWGGPVNAGNANNYGQTQSSFQVVIAGSNGYVNNTIGSPPGYSTATYLGNAAISAPYDSQGYDTYMGSVLFNSGPFNASLCADHCNAQSLYNIANPPSDGSPVQTCQFFNTYILYLNDTTHLQGQYCMIYSETWPASYGTNTGQYYMNDHYMVEYSYAYSNLTNPNAKPNKVGAIHQASKDISYSTLQPFCSTLLGYTVALTTATVTNSVTATSTVTVTTHANKKRALPTPSVLTKYPATVISSACSLQVSPGSGTSTGTSSVTVTASVATVSVTATT